MRQVTAPGNNCQVYVDFDVAYFQFPVAPFQTIVSESGTNGEIQA